jgi:hypothetical protein
MAKRIKKEEPVEEQVKKNCDCEHPILIPQRYSGANGVFTFCKKCKLERRLNLEELF